MKIEFNDGQLIVYAAGNNFQDQIESCKYLGMRYEPTLKAWSISAGKFNEVVEEMKQYHIEFSEYDKVEMNKYFSSLEELKKITKRSEYRKYLPDLLTMEPIG